MDAEPSGDVPGAATCALVELLFCSVSRNVVVLDCRAASGPGDGWPFVMRLGLPAHGAWSAAAERMLMRWAAQSAVVSVEIRAGQRPVRVRLFDDDAAVLLDATAAGPVFR